MSQSTAWAEAKTKIMQWTEGKETNRVRVDDDEIQQRNAPQTQFKIIWESFFHRKEDLSLRN
jgi:hypothetical protein